jgi:hypothetical protein
MACDVITINWWNNGNLLNLFLDSGLKFLLWKIVQKINFSSSIHWKKFYFRGTSKSLCFKIFGFPQYIYCHSSSYNCHNPSVFFLLGSWQLNTWAVAVNVLREPKNFKTKEFTLAYLGSKQFWVYVQFLICKHQHIHNSSTSPTIFHWKPNIFLTYFNRRKFQ